MNHEAVFAIKDLCKPGMVGHTYNHSTGEAETGGPLQV